MGLVYLTPRWLCPGARFPASSSSAGPRVTKGLSCGWGRESRWSPRQTCQSHPSKDDGKRLFFPNKQRHFLKVWLLIRMTKTWAQCGKHVKSALQWVLSGRFPSPALPAPSPQTEAAFSRTAFIFACFLKTWVPAAYKVKVQTPWRGLQGSFIIWPQQFSWSGRF